ncbi:hypothetical protein EDD68_10793 [Melghiribacillus thermohalophilus]|uniref:Uncharacterized protein n=1 Tax=Melghiribacillus thermohalophilus TaxID=1324956 RepID=A0A4R3N8W2_9BACI|nr:DUF2975 domain-containing protein [Melghiribacillus thermohalophilus]TCT23379.1 hypothetical protein EDD68_10793 [Melghiribacillus thermohalophilus]
MTKLTRLIKKDKIFYLFENWTIAISLSLLFIFFLSNHILYKFDIWIYHMGTEYFIQSTLRNSLFDMKNALLTVAAIFIGIYVTVFTLLGSIKVDSIFAFLNEKNFKKLVNFIRNAFIAAFLYIILIIFLEVYYIDYNDIPVIFLIINLIIVLYMFATALRFGIILYFAFKKDLNNLPENIKKHREEHKRIRILFSRVENFIDDYEKEKSKDKAERMGKIINEEKETDNN